MLRALSLGVLLSLAAPARADQVVVTDVTYVHSATTTHDSHLIVDALPETPASLRAPVDYASGTAYVRLEVLTKPSDAPTRYQVCFNASPTYACTDQAPPYTTTGVYTWATPFDRFWQGDLPDWSRGLGRTISLILKDTANRKPSPENVGAEVSARYMPTSLRVTVTLVSPGSTYVPPDEPTDEDAGVVDEDAGPRSSDAGAGGGDAGTASADADVDDAGALAPDAGAVPRDGAPAPADPPPTAAGGCSASPRPARLSGLAAIVMLACIAAGRRRRATG